MGRLGAKRDTDRDTVLARDIRVGDVIDGWTVLIVDDGCIGVQWAKWPIVLLALEKERKFIKDAADVETHQPDPYSGGDNYTVTRRRRAWYPANEELDLER